MGGRIPENWICAAKWKEAGGREETLTRQENWACAKLCTKGKRAEKYSVGNTGGWGGGMEREREFKGERGVWPHLGDFPQNPQMERVHWRKGTSYSEHCWLPGPFWHLFTSSHPLRMLRPSCGSSHTVTPEIPALSLTCDLSLCIRLVASGFWGVVWYDGVRWTWKTPSSAT